MAKRLGPRFGLEAGFLVAVAVVLGLLEVTWQAIVGAMAIAWLVVAAIEIVLARRPQPPTPETIPEPEPAAAPAPEPEPFTAPVEPVHVPPLVAPPPPPPVPEPVAEPEPEPEPTPSPPPAATREWNLWELERLAREHAGADPARDEERSFLLLSLREHAQPDGNLPAEFDQLVRDAFGDVLQTPA